MNQLPELPDIQIVEANALRPHEHIDVGRSERLIQSLQTEGFLKNPPVVLRLQGEIEQYVVLDGANRTTAVQRMGFPHMLVQIANEGVDVRNWNHILMGGDLQELQERMRQMPCVDVVETDEFRAAAALARGESAAYMVLPDGRTLLLETEGDSIFEKIECLTHFVNLYEGSFDRERTVTSSLNGLVSLYPEMRGLIVFPEFGVNDIVEIAKKGQLLPSGLTRFLISPRALRINFPLAMLADRSPIDEKRAALSDWIRQRVEQRRVRFYAESTFVFDE